jgi:hypothetical protein
MAEIRTVTTLTRKREEMRASIRMYEKEIAQARADLAHVTAVMQLFEVSGRAQPATRTGIGYSAGVSHGPSAPRHSPAALSPRRIWRWN